MSILMVGIGATLNSASVMSEALALGPGAAPFHPPANQGTGHCHYCPGTQPQGQNKLSAFNVPGLYLALESNSLGQIPASDWLCDLMQID